MLSRLIEVVQVEVRIAQRVHKLTEVKPRHMRDHLRQEKTGDLPSPLAPVPRQTAFSKGTLGLWSSDHFVIYYRDGRVPQPGIIILGQVTGDVSMFDRPGAVTVRVELAPR